MMSGRNPSVQRQKSLVHILPTQAGFRAMCTWAPRLSMWSQMAEFPFLWLNNITLYILYISFLHSYISLIHSPVNGNRWHPCLGECEWCCYECWGGYTFWIRFFVGIQISLQGNDFHFLQIYPPKVGLLSHMVVLILISWGISILSLLMAIHVHFLIKVLIPCFLFSMTIILIDVIARCVSDLHFPDDWWRWASFMYPPSIHMSSLRKTNCLFRSFAHF